MGRDLKKHYSTDPNQWINNLGKINVKVYPDMVEKKIALETTDSKGRKSVKYFGKKLDNKTYIDSWYKALEYFSEKLCKDVT